VLKEEVEIVVLMPDQLKKLIYDKSFEQSLRLRLQLVKDIFVLGATVALRYGDLIQLSWTDIIERNGSSYLCCRSEKTDTSTIVKLPNYVLEVLAKYKRRKRKHIFPDISLDNFDGLVKELFERAGWTDPVSKKRNVRGIAKVLKPTNGRQNFRFCDLATSHMMRRTAITTMLMHGVQETIVKQIAGHAKSSKSFYRYIAFVQSFMDLEIDKHFEKMEH
jgi:integrase